VIQIKDAKERLQKISKQADMLKVISHPVRLCIIRGLLNEPGCNVSKIMGCLDMPQSTISQHLARLKSAGIVEGVRNGLEVNYYVINEDVIKVVGCLIEQ
jgi:ArsR family transcriptional regulator